MYSKSKRAIKHVEVYLAQMVLAQGRLEFPVDDAGKAAYSLREGIHASQYFAVDDAQQPVEPYASYAALNSKFIMRAKGNMVVCEPRDVVPSMRLRESMSQVSIPSVKDTLSVIGAAIMHKAPVMIFPHANASTVDSARILSWCDTNNYTVVIADNHVTMTRKPVALGG